MCAVLAVAAFAFCAAAQPAALGQAISATLSGKITDASGGSVAKASVTVTNAANGLARTAPSSDTGDYYIPSLPAGDYKVTVEFAGFRKQTKDI